MSEQQRRQPNVPTTDDTEHGTRRHDTPQHRHTAHRPARAVSPHFILSLSQNRPSLTRKLQQKKNPSKVQSGQTENNLMDKRALLDERRRKWMTDRETSMVREETTREMRLSVGALPPPSSSAAAATASFPGVMPPTLLAHTEQFLHKLTDKLASHIREEVRKEIQSSAEFSGEDLAEKMDNYLQDELSTHTCKICFDLMDSDVGKTPVLLFPCGHTFCELCLQSHAKTQAKRGGATLPSAVRGSTSNLSQLTRTTCPYCRSVVESAAVNQALKDLIGQFAKQRKSVIGKDFSQLQSQHRQAKGADDYDNDDDDDYGSYGARSRRHSPSKATASKRGNGQDPRLLSKYTGQLRSCEMRATILTNELDDARRDLHAVDKKKKVLADASTHLSREKHAVREQMRQLEEELALIDKHLAEQEGKRAALEEEGQQSAARVELTEHTLTNLHAEMEKLHILVQGLK